MATQNAIRNTVTDANFTVPSGQVYVGTASPANPYDISVEQAVNGLMGISVQNTSAGASAGANIQHIVEVGAADAFSIYSVNGGGTWSVGLDNSDTDSFKITTGSSPSAGTIAIKADSSGNITTANSITATTGNLTLTSGLLALPSTTSTVGQITINSSRFMHAFGTNNTFLGTGAGNFSLSGTGNTGVGFQSADAITSGLRNTCVGAVSGGSLTTGNDHTLIGWGAGASLGATVSFCTAVGSGALAVETSSGQNTAIGYEAQAASNGAGLNTSVGYQALKAITTGASNTSIGHNSGSALTTGTFNLFAGVNAGSSLTGSDSSNIIIRNAGTAGDNNTIRIGSNGSGIGQQNKCYVAGIYNTTPASATQQLAVISDGHQFGSIPYTAWTAFTPSLDFTSGSTGITYTTQTGAYQRVGDTVFFAVRISLSNKGSSTGNARITGLPITSSATTGGSAMVIPVYSNITFTGYGVGIITNGGTQILLREAVSGGAPTDLTDADFTNSSSVQIWGFYEV